ncbi:M56 family metallopeptidase [Pedosphaera parvula]|uniref:Peptidase M56 BlaR1 n=1 Tax=Pedosphaera parvula (strain Ellin514) TaxID=320771 RepID=B9XKK8_PEDPL|nr:M56 family metallopeptidase [Pedosphaera parvula]EEF59678.1 peptidase M56 BlaR1 [Pedosphaera parvula Ellin514]
MSGTDLLIECLGWTLLHFLWEGLVIALVLAIAMRVLRRASASSRYVAGCLALMMMVAAPAGTFIHLTKQHAPVSEGAFQPRMESLPLEITPRFVPMQAAKVVVTEQKKTALKMTLSERLTPLLPLLVAGWAVGVILLALRLSTGWLRVKRLKRLGTESMEEIWHARLAELAGRLHIKKTVRLCKSVLVEVPTVIGWLRPIILMPAGCLAGLSPAQVEYILAHELAHVRRHDYLVNLLQCLAETILFYHPAVWWVSKRIREERENCCDDVAVSVCGDPLGYARTLAALEELRGSQNQLVMAAAGAPLLQRIRRLLGQAERNPSHQAWPLAGIIVLLLVAALTIGLRSSRAVADQTQETISKTNKLVTGRMLPANARKTFVQSDKSLTGAQLPQIVVQSKFFEVDEKDFPKAIFNLPAVSNAVCAIATPWQPVSAPKEQCFTGMLTGPQYQAAVKQLEMASCIDMLTAPSVITQSGRQAQIQAVDLIEILTNASPSAAKMQLPFGPVLDVLPTVTPDKLGVQLTGIATVTMLLDAPSVVLPRIQFTQLSTEMTLKDGQTLVMGGLMPETITIVKDRVPVLADIPLAGRLFRSGSTSKSRKYLIVFVTPTLINPDGSRYHADDTKPTEATVLPPETLLFETRLLLDAGKIEEAEVKLNLVAEKDPLNPRIAGFRELIQKAKQNQETISIQGETIKNAAKLSIPGLRTDIPLHSTGANLSYTYYLKNYDSSNRIHKLLSVRIPEVAFNGVSLTNAIEVLNAKIKATGSNDAGIQLALPPDRLNTGTLPDAVLAQSISDNLHSPSPTGTNNEVDFGQWRAAAKKGESVRTRGGSVHIKPLKIMIDPALKNVTVAEVLEAVAKSLNASAEYRVEQDKVMVSFKLKSITDSDGKFYKGVIKTNILSQDSDVRTNALEVHTNQSAPTYVKHGEVLDVNYPSKGGTPEEKLQEMVKQLPLPNFIARTNSVKTSSGRQAILSKLDRIRVDSIEYDGLPLAEVINNLSEIARTRDPDRAGINFFINREAPATATVGVVPGAIDPTTGLPTAGAALSTEPVDVGGVTVKIAPALTNVCLADVLDAITKTSDKPIKYSIEDYAVVFSLKGPETVPLFTRAYRIDPTTLRDGLEAVGGVAFGNVSADSQGGGGQQGGIRNVDQTNSYADVQIAARNFFAAAGVHFNPANPANVGKYLFFNERKGTLVVHATQEDLNLIGKLLGKIEAAAPQSQIKARSVEQDQAPDGKINVDAPPNHVEEQLTNSIASSSRQEKEIQPYFTRLYRVNSNALLRAVGPLRPQTGNERLTYSHVSYPKDGTQPVTNLVVHDRGLQTAIRSFFEKANIDFSPTNPVNVGKSVFYNELNATLMVRTTQEELDLIQKELARITPPQINIKARFVEMDETAGSQITLGESMRGIDSKTNSSMTQVTTPKVSSSGSFPPVTNALALQFTGVLTPEQYKEAITRLERADGVDLLTAPDVTTESGRRAQIQAVDIKTIITGLTTVYTNGTATNMLSTQNLPFGPVLDVIPKVSADDSSIEMNLVASVTEFVGYDDPKKLAGQKRTDVQIPLPHFRLRQLTSSASVADGHTIILGGVEQNTPGKRGKEKPGKRKTLLVFVTPTLINPDGSLYHPKTEQAALRESKKP